MSENTFDLGRVSQTIKESGSGIPPVEKWNPDFCGDIDMRIVKDGKWYYMGTPIGRPAMVKLFSTVLWFEEGKHYLKTPVEKIGIQVDDAPFLFTELEVESREGKQVLLFTSTTGDVVEAGPEHVLWVDECADSGEPSPYINVRFGMKGLIHRNVFYQLVELAEELEDNGAVKLVVSSHGERFSLGEIA